MRAGEGEVERGATAGGGGPDPSDARREGAAAREREDWGPSRDRYDRQRRIPGWDQARLQAAHVLVAGAGAIGNEAIKLLALLGIGRLTIVDMDRIEASNLARTVLFREEDVGAPKAEVAARRARELASGARIEAIVGDIEHDLGLGRLREATAILGCVDNLHARIALNRAAQRVGVPWVNAAIAARALEVAAFVPGGACYECALGDRAWRRYRRRFSCGDGLRRAAREGRVATVATLASLAAALQVEAALALLHGGKGREGDAPAFGLVPGERLFFSVAPLSFSRGTIPRAPDCVAHESWPAPVAAPRAAAEASFDALARWLEERHGTGPVEALELDFDLVTALECARCATVEERLAPKARLVRQDARCPQCGSDRAVRGVTQVPRESALARIPLARLGIPEREIVRVRAENGRDLFVELGDGNGGAISNGQ